MKHNIYAGLSEYARKKFLERDKKLQLLKIILDYYNTDMNTLLIRGRKRDKVKILAIACYILYWRGGLKLTEIGKLFNKHHSTIIHHCNVIESIVNGNDIVKRANADIIKDYNNIINLINQSKNKYMETNEKERALKKIKSFIRRDTYTKAEINYISFFIDKFYSKKKIYSPMEIKELLIELITIDAD